MTNLSFEHTNDVSCLVGFHCGVYEMDKFIQNSFESHLRKVEILDNYIVRNNDGVVGLCTLKDHKLNITEGRYIDTVEIEYLAVDREVQNKGIGRSIISWVCNKVKAEKPEIKIITVDAFISDVTAYTAVPFYKKCGFIVLENKHPLSEVVKMALVIK